MILFQLKCENDHEFEAWFKDGATYEAQAANGDLSCPMCGTSNVGKALMAPRLRTSRQKEVAAEKQKQKAVAEATQAAIAEIRKQVESNCENVGNKFAEEARKNPELVKTAPHNQAIAQVKGDAFENPAKWAMTWRAYQRKVQGETKARGVA